MIDFIWPVSEGYVVGQTITYTRDLRWWKIWRNRLRQFKWNVPKTETAEWRVIHTTSHL